MESEDKVCEFCGYEGDSSRVTFNEKRNYGKGPSSDHDYWLCGYCENSLAANSYLSGVSKDYTLAQDLMMGLNVLQDALQGKDNHATN